MTGGETRLEMVRELTGSEEPCPYLPEPRATISYRFIDGCSPQTYQHMLARGWRRFGRAFFRPICRSCAECRSLRLDVDAFRPNRSMRRTVRRNQGLRIELARPSVTEDHLALYHRYHQDMNQRRGWSPKAVSLEDYYFTFIDGFESFGYELTFHWRDRLVAVALTDILPEAISAVYCFYDPDLRQRSLGVFAILQQVNLARKRGVPFLYLGFWVAGNRSMRYKSGYRPNELLVGRPDLDQEPVWRAPDPEAVDEPG